MCVLVTVLVIVFYSSPHTHTHTVSSQDEVIGFLTWTVDEITALIIIVLTTIAHHSTIYLIHDLIYWRFLH